MYNTTFRNMTKSRPYGFGEYTPMNIYCCLILD